MTAKPYMLFYPSDWRGDPALRMCSLAARGLWQEMLGVMHGAEPYGYLLVNGQKLTIKQLASLVGARESEVQRLIEELHRNGVYSVSEHGVIYSRRMTREAVKAERDRANGKKGGNPKLKPGVNPPDNPAPNPTALSPTTTTTTTLESKKESKSADAIASDAAASREPPEAKLFRVGVQLLDSLGVTEKRSRPMIGRWRRDTGDDCNRVLAAIYRAQEMAVSDAPAFITAMLKPQGKQPNGSSENLVDAAKRLGEQNISFGPRPRGLREEAGGTDVRLLPEK